MKDLVLFGAGGHCKVVIEAIQKQGLYQIMGILDDDERLLGKEHFGCRILGGRNWHFPDDCALIVTIGANPIRRDIADAFRRRGLPLGTAVDPSCQVSRGVRLGQGTVLLAAAIVSSDTVIGNNVVINTGAIVSHDCQIGDDVHISPGANIGGGAVIESGVLVGIGANILPRGRVGRDAIVAAGSCVITRVEAGTTVIGVPARPLRPAVRSGNQTAS